MPYTPATRDTASATLVTRTSETIDGKVSGERAVPAGNVLRPSNQSR